jgi:hypothetical protein
MDTFHKYNCHTLYIPEDIDLEKAFQSVAKSSLHELQKKARELGASRAFVKQFNDREGLHQLKSYIIQNSISDEHILFNDITEEVATRENIQKRDYCRHITREISEWYSHNDEYGRAVPPPPMNTSCPPPGSTLDRYESVVIPTSMNRLESNHEFLQNEFLEPEDMIRVMKQDEEYYEDRHISFWEE